jgi:hypothetical protein
MLRILFLILILFASIAFGQDKTKAWKIDEFGLLGECDMGFRLDALQIELTNDPSLKGYIIAYQKVGALPADLNSSPMISRINERFSFLRVDPLRIEFKFGGYQNMQMAEIWIVPKNAENPVPIKGLPKPEMPTDKTFLYGRRNLYFSDYQYPIEYLSASAKRKRIKFEKEAAEENKKNGVEDYTEDEYKLSVEEIEEMKFNWVVESFGDVLKSRNGFSGEIIYYADKKDFNLNTIKLIIAEGARKISNNSGIPLNSIKITYGGYRDSLQAEYWIIPPKGNSPKPTPEKRIDYDSEQ